MFLHIGSDSLAGIKSAGAPDAVIASGDFDLDVILNKVKDIRRRIPTTGSAVLGASVRRAPSNN